MRILGTSWSDGYLDEAVRPGYCRIQPRTWVVVLPVSDAYFVRPRSWRMLYNYIREIGVIASAQKVASRSRERLRNERFISCGLGRILEANAATGVSPGDQVLFIAASGPRAAERIVLPVELTRPAKGRVAEGPADHIALGRATLEAAEAFAPLAGWSPDSGRPLPPRELELAFTRAAQLVTETALTRRLDLARALPVRERSEPRRGASRHRPTAVLFGFGNYAKTVVLPNVRRHLDVRLVHEVDPTQIGRVSRGARMGFDTSPGPRPEDGADAWLIAGYHHTHAPLAREALRRGIAAVVEKPIATTPSDLDSLLREMSTPGRRVFACFQRRYLHFNALVRDDLEVGSDEPISYHCVVYEVPLPRLHWYRWPASRTRMLSNGCHWVDHFLHLNGFSAPIRRDVQVARDGTATAFVELENGAVFTMTLTDRGSDRIGLQDHTELRTARGTATITNASHYRAETSSRVIRELRRNRLDAYRTMYSDIARRIAAGAPGDEPRTLDVSARTTLAMDELLMLAS
jgi:predicted dehydrogenase